MSTWKRVLTEDDGNLATTNLSTASARTYQLTSSNSLTFLSQHGTELLKFISAPVTANGDSVDLEATVRLRHPVGSLAGVLVLKEATDNGDSSVNLRAPASLSANYTLTLPTTDGDADQVLKTDGSGNLSWVDQSSGSGTIDGSGSANRVTYWSDSDTLASSSKFVVNATSGSLEVGSLSAQTSKGSGSVSGEIGSFNKIIVGASTGTTAGNTGTGSRLFSKFGTGVVSAGKVHAKTDTNTWAAAANDDLAEASGLLAVATEAASSQIMLKEGAVKMASNQGFSSADTGAPLYLSSQAGAVTSTVPSSGSNPVYVRLVGYVIDASNSIIYFDPDKSWLEI